MRRSATLVLLALLLPSLRAESRTIGVTAAARPMKLEERVRAQRAIEEVFWRHRIWPKGNKAVKPALSSVLPDDAVRERVIDSIAKSNAASAIWRRPISAEQLQREVERMARQLAFPVEGYAPMLSETC